MPGGLRRFVIGLLFTIAFAFLLIFFIYSFLNQTNPSSDLFNEKYGLNSSMFALNGTIEGFKSTVNETQAILAESNPSATEFLFLIFQGAFQIPKAILTFLSSGISSLTQLFLGLTGGNGVLALVIPLILAVIVITFVFLIVKAIRTGETEY